MDAGALMALCAEGYFALLGGFAALATIRALSEGDGEGLGRRVFASLTRTTFFLGVPGLIAFLMFMKSESTGHGGGIMSPGMAMFVLFVGGFFALIALWLAAVLLGYIAAQVAKDLTPLAAGAVMAAFLAGAPLLTGVLWVLARRDAEIKEMLRRR
jgi:hypothetical protein